MAISEDEVARLHKANRPSAQVHLRTETTKLIFYSYVECELQFICGRMYEYGSKMDTDEHDWKNTCLKFSLLSFSEIQCLFEDREICVFFGNFNVTTPQRRSSQHTHTLTNTNTHTHAWPTVASRASGSRGVFSGFANYF